MHHPEIFGLDAFGEPLLELLPTAKQRMGEPVPQRSGMIDSSRTGREHISQVSPKKPDVVSRVVLGFGATRLDSRVNDIVLKLLRF